MTIINGQRFTGMSTFEGFLWSKFLEEHGPEFFDYEYNVRLYRPISVPKDWPQEYKQNANDLTAYRIDAVAKAKGQIVIFEVRPDAKHSAIGNLIFYRFLYILQFAPTVPVKMVLITNSYAPAIEMTARAAQIAYYVY